MKKKFIAQARVSSREQEREGFSLDVQVEGFERYAEQHGGVIEKLFSVAETATRPEERRTFKELLAYAKKRAHQLDGLLFYKVDRGARNLLPRAGRAGVLDADDAPRRGGEAVPGDRLPDRRLVHALPR